MSIDELKQVLSALMRAQEYKLATLVRCQIVGQELARDAILDYQDRQHAILDSLQKQWYR